MKSGSAKFSLLVFLILMGGVFGFSKKITTRNTAPKQTDIEAAARKNIPVITEDSIGFHEIADNLIFLAYDKKTSASKETFFIENKSDSDLKSLNIEISYFTSDGKLIHRRETSLDGDFRSGETRKVDISSWDTQKSYHYIHSAASKKGSTPYSVRIRVLSFTEEQ